MSVLNWIFDGILALALFWVAWQSLTISDGYQAIMRFMAFGLLMALTWARLSAPDVALAQIVLSAGATGALLLDALRDLGDEKPCQDTKT